jgi:transketolase
MFFDSNDIQLSTSTDEVTSEDTAMKYKSWGWNVIEINGHNHNEIRKALTQANNEKSKPTLIIGKTIMGKGCVTSNGEMYEGHCELHGKPIGETGADYAKTLQNLGANANNPFEIFEDVKEYYTKIIDQKEKDAAKKKNKINQWKTRNDELSKKLDKFLTGDIPSLDFESINHKQGLATRASSSNVLAYLAENVENMIVSSADLSNSDKTDGFLSKTSSIQKNNFKGSFLQAGVAELTMASIANGIALHGGVIPVVATFFVFSDYMKPAIRLSAIQELPVKYVWTHDAFRVGEDGPTHQPIEQEAQIRLLEKLKNHSGKQSFLALRPADSSETTIAWKMAIENTKTPTGLILSRQGIKDIPALNENRYREALNSEKGGYLVKEVANPDIVLVANGSEVATLFEAAEILESKNGLKVNVVSVISEGLFRNQPKEYQEKIIPSNKPLFGLTAGLPVNLEGLVGANGKVFGLDHFGYSAPATILDEKFGFTGEQVSKRVMEYLESIQAK